MGRRRLGIEKVMALARQERKKKSKEGLHKACLCVTHKLFRRSSLVNAILSRRARRGCPLETYVGRIQRHKNTEHGDDQRDYHS